MSQLQSFVTNILYHNIYWWRHVTDESVTVMYQFHDNGNACTISYKHSGHLWKGPERDDLQHLFLIGQSHTPEDEHHRFSQRTVQVLQHFFFFC